MLLLSLQNLEHLIGTDHFEERILQLKSSIHTLTEQIEACHADVSLIEEEREQLLPQVQKWERYGSQRFWLHDHKNLFSSIDAKDD